MEPLNNSTYWCPVNRITQMNHMNLLKVIDKTCAGIVNKVIFNHTDAENGAVCNGNLERLVQRDVEASSSLIVTILIVILISLEISLPYIPFQSLAINHRVIKKTLKRALMLLFMTIILPLITLILLASFVIKNVCKLIIIKQDKLFVSYLDSFDVFWSLEDDSSKSIINVLGIVEAESAEVLVKNIKIKLTNIKPNKSTDKIFYKRSEKFGFFYWRKHEIQDIDQYVKVLKSKDGKAKCLNINDLEDIMEVVANRALPYRDEGLFEIIVTDQNFGTVGDKNLHGIIFRIHHAVGDGVALVEFLCRTLAENEDCKLKLFTNPNLQNFNRKSPNDLYKMIKTLWEVPICFVDGILRIEDDNTLHGPKLTGKKIFKWTKGDEKLLTLVKEIKDSFKGMKFTDVLAAALATGLRNFLTEKSSCVPEKLAVVLPIRFPEHKKNKGNLELRNDFSVSIMDLPILSGGLREVQLRGEEIRKSADPLTNYYFLKLAGATLPSQILQPLLNSSQATMILSNMPGPDTIRICDGDQLTNLVFFVPLKGTTGLGITALCYGGVLRFGAVADRAVVSNRQDLETILAGMEDEIRRLHRDVVV